MDGFLLYSLIFDLTCVILGLHGCLDLDRMYVYVPRLELVPLRLWGMKFLKNSMYIRDLYCNIIEDCRERLSPDESWAGGPPTPLVRLRGRWGRHTY